MADEQLWAAYLARARWFQGKGLPLRGLSIHPLPWYVATTGLRLRSELAEADLGERHQTYHLLVGYAPCGAAEPDAVVGQTDLAEMGRVDLIDVPRSPFALRALLEAFTRGRVPGLTWYRAPSPDDLAARLLVGEQSHTNVRLGHDALLKVYRRLSPGRNPEIQVLADLADHYAADPTARAITPGLIGTWASPDGSHDLGFFSEFVPDARDGYEYAVEACAHGVDLAGPMRDLGATLATLHAQLRMIYGTSVTASAALLDAIRQRLAQASRHSPELAPLEAGLLSRLDAPDASEPLQRIHGDFHLGQALSGRDGWRLIDFEGEPLTPHDLRGAPDTVWRDVAGLLRSLDYVRHTHPEPDGEPARQWLAQARSGFLAGYLGPDATPSPLLKAYEIDKAVYELRYETRNRPAWVGTPLGFLRQAAREAP